MAKIKFNISCSNLAPLQDFNSSLELNSLQIGIFANNGTGKTFLSRAFELAASLKSKWEPLFPFSSLITFGQQNTSFSLQIIDKEGRQTENINLNITRDSSDLQSEPSYIYHVFNQDYVEQNIEYFQYDKNPNVQGYILGEASIDLSNDERILKEIEEKGKALKASIEKQILDFTSSMIDPIPNIIRLSEYKGLAITDLLNFRGEIDEIGIRPLSLCLEDYNKIKAVPQPLSTINSLSVFKELENLSNLYLIFQEEYTINRFADELRKSILEDRLFFEKGIDLYKKGNQSICPFCRQLLHDESLGWIDSIVDFFKDKESQILKMLSSYELKLRAYIEYLNNLESEYLRAFQLYSEYKSKYFSNLSSIEIEFNPKPLIDTIDSILGYIKSKKDNISISLCVPEVLVADLQAYSNQLRDSIANLNLAIESANSSIAKVDSLNRSIRRDILRSARIHILKETSEKRDILNKIRVQFNELNQSIKLKRNAIKTERKELIVSIIRKVLNHFFSDKYTFDANTFRLILRHQPLIEKEAKRVLSDGEKSIVAFAYFIGDTISQVSSESDFDKLFFIFDDPISSMDYNYVYTLVDVLRELTSIFDKMKRSRFIALTHNNDFMRILAGNDVTKENFYLDNNSLLPLDENFSVPYISHLRDIYRISIGQLNPSHTTPNSIRHIIETIMKWSKLEVSQSKLKEFLKEAFSDCKQNYTLINDLSHGGWRTEQQPITKEDMISICKDVISYITKILPGQVDYCASLYGK